MVIRTGLLSALLAALLLAGVAGCSAGPATGASAGTSAGTSAGSAAVTPAGSSADAATPSPAQAGQTSQTTADSGGLTGPDGKPDGASGILRLWWSPRQTLNPLLDDSESGRVVNGLVFEGLFRMNGQQQPQPQLASKAVSSGGGYQLLINLAKGRQFHDGSPVTAADVAACIEFIRSRPLSPYANSLLNIDQVVIVDNQTIRLFLGKIDPWLTCKLTFPIIPAASLAADPLQAIPGTGPFRMQAYSAKSGLNLVKARPTGTIAELKVIHLAEYDNLAKAMQAFEADEIDLVSLPAAEYSRYMLRNSLRFEQFTGNQMLFLAYNTQEKHLLSETSRLLYLKRLFVPDAVAAAGAGQWGESTALPLPAASWLLAGGKPDYPAALARLGQPAWPATDRQLDLLVPSDDRIKQKVANILGGMLEQAGIGWQLESLPDLEYQAALEQGHYDLALLEAVMPAAPDPGWLYSDDRPEAFAILKTIAAGNGDSGLADYGLWQKRLAEAVASAASADGVHQAAGKNFADILGETAARSPWSVLLIRSAAVLYGDRVIGQCQPDRYNPYQGIEELWIWSGQLS